MEALELRDSDFSGVLAGKTGILFFYKKICPNCKALKKGIEKFAAANPDAVIMQIDSEENPRAMETFGVEKAPTIFVIKAGETAARKVGLLNVQEMTALYRSA
jgi:thioredoxin 1